MLSRIIHCQTNRSEKEIQVLERLYGSEFVIEKKIDLDIRVTLGENRISRSNLVRHQRSIPWDNNVIDPRAPVKRLVKQVIGGLVGPWN